MSSTREKPVTEKRRKILAIPGAYTQKNFKFYSTIPHDRFCQLMEQSCIVVAHAGMCTILTALHMSKPIVVFPHFGSLGEHRNDHQIATAKQFKAFGYVYVAHKEDELRKHIFNPDLKPLHTKGACASPQLVSYIHDFVLL